MRSTINNIKYISRDGSRKKENNLSSNLGKPLNSNNFLKSNQNYFSSNNFNMKSLKDNPMNRHQRYKSQNIEINTDFNKGEENKNNERNIFGKFSPLNSKDVYGINIKNNYNIGNNMGNFTSNNFGNNKFIKCKIQNFYFIINVKFILFFFN